MYGGHGEGREGCTPWLYVSVIIDSWRGAGSWFLFLASGENSVDSGSGVYIALLALVNLLITDIHDPSARARQQCTAGYPARSMITNATLCYSTVAGTRAV
jgi:hypothetical protein